MRGFILLFCLLAANAQIQPPAINSNAAAAYESLLRLRTTATVLHLTAHPDDEDAALITWLARAQGVRTGLLTLTRGEGGENLIGSELNDALGLLRTEELLAADRFYGVDQFFTRAADFGFSKRLEETLERWGSENVLRDCVRAVRLYRPDILISRFADAPGDGHGNHQAAGRMSVEVFKAAADPNRFPEHFREGLRPWQIKKLYRSASEDEPRAIRIDTGGYDSLIGMSYRQVAEMGLSYQRSQGAGQPRAAAGPAISAVALVTSAFGEKPDSALFDGIDTTLRGLALLAPALNLETPLGEIDRDVFRAIEEFDARDPSRVIEPHLVPALRNLRAVIRTVSDSTIDQNAKYDLLFRLRNKEDEFMRAGNLLAGVSFEVLADGSPAAIPGQKFTLTGTFTNRSNVKMENVEVGLSVRGQIQFSSKPVQKDSLGYNERAQQPFEVTIGGDTPYTQPYWSRKDPYRDAIYEISESEFLNLPHAPPEIVATATYRIDGVRFNVTQPAETIRGIGAPHHELTIAPAISVMLTPRLGVIPVTRRPLSIEVHPRVVSNAAGADAKVRLELPLGWTATPAQTVLHFTRLGEIQNADFKISIPQVANGNKYTVQAIAEWNGKEYREGYEVIAHPDLEARHLYRTAASELTAVDVRVSPSLKVGYIMGAGDEIPEALAQIGVKPQMLGPGDLASGNLTQFDTILVGIRASTVRPDYRAYNSRLMDYVKNGGNLIVQYQGETFPYGPFSLNLGAPAEEVSEEDAKVTILDPSNPIFTAPNKITAADFDRWVDERGSQFMDRWDAQYKPLLECHDRGQAPQKGGLLQARYGKGTFTYVAYAFYRQFPAGVPGAYRLFANMISLGKAPK